MPDDVTRTECRRLNYRGRVQGVGFRYTTIRIAKRYPVEGYVKNLRDGSVELVVIGTADEVDAFLKDVETAFSGHIDECQSAEIAPPGPFSGFEVRY